MQSPRRKLLVLLAAWCCCTLAGWWLYAAAAAGDHTPGLVQSSWMKMASNLVQTVCMPGWIFARVLTGGGGAWWTTPLALAVGWGIAFTFLGLLLEVRQRLIGRRPKNERVPNKDRRRFIVDGALAGGAGLAGIGGAGATLVVPWSLRTTRYSVSISNLPLELDGLRLAVLTDTHLGPRVPAAFIARAVRKALELKPDVVLLGGDYVHSDAAFAPAAAELFRPFTEERIPTFAVLGNHDWYAGGLAVAEALRDVGIEVIDNESRFIDAQTRRLSSALPESGLAIAGIGDIETDTVSFEAALRRIPSSMPRLLLSHQPDAAEWPEFLDSLHRVDLMICGHTHGGQVKLPLLGTPIVPSRFGSKYASGLVDGPACKVLVSCGIGTSSIPVRWGVPPEIVALTLRAT